MGCLVLAMSAIVLITGEKVSVALDRAPGRPTTSVQLQLVVEGLGRGSIQLLKKEVEAIWMAQGVRIVWTGDNVTPAVLVLIKRPESPLPPVPAEEQWHVAATHSVAGRIVPEMYVSLDAAERVVHSSSPPYSAPALAGIIVPRVAARAIAHELAHYLLDTRDHTADGLLRARFSANEFVAPGRDGFVLDSVQIAGVHRRLEMAQSWTARF
jgi:hypothetical protein